MRLAPLAFFCAVFFAAIAIAPICHADPVVLNGSFESPPNSGSGISDPGQGGTSWIVGGPNASVFLVSNGFSGFGSTPFGNQYLALTTPGMPGASDHQIISGFLAGQSYVVDLYISSVPTNINPELEVDVSGAAMATGTFVPSSSPMLNFQEVQLPFTTTGAGDITLQLLDVGSAAIAVDNVSIEAVPEPSTVAAMVLLAGTLSVTAARRFLANRHRRDTERG